MRRQEQAAAGNGAREQNDREARVGEEGVTGRAGAVDRSSARPSRLARRRPRARPRARVALESLESRQVMAVVISELMASNSSTIADADGDYADWLELRNDGSASVNLNGYFLTDNAGDPTRWTLPSASLSPGQHLLVWASGKDRAAAGQPLHTNFKLSADGEYLALMKPDGATVEFAYAPAYPAQTDDVSYGLSVNGQQRGYFPQATPGAANGVPIPDAARAVIISEVMYSLPRADILDAENIREEFIELHNRGQSALSVKDWQLTRGVSFTLPDYTIPAGGQLVVAADVAVFQAKYPGVANVVGGWQGTLSNNGEAIELVDASGATVDRVEYSNEGDWATRAPGPDDNGHKGWVWSAPHNGGGKSLELINLSTTNDDGANWASSQPDGGTPGRVNSVVAANIAPVIRDVLHQPAVPHSNQAVTITARLSDETPQGLVASLLWRIAGQGSFQAVDMLDDGTRGDGAAGDGLYGVQVPPQANGAVIEFYVRGRDATNLERTWPAPTTAGKQETNALYQVVNGLSQDPLVPGSPHVYHVIMTPAERTEFRNINRASDAQFNSTFIAITGTGTDIRYNAGTRIRGSGSRQDPIPNNRVNIPADQPWNGVSAININQVSPVNQVAGSALLRLGGQGVSDVHAVRMYSNGDDLKNGGYYVAQEVLDVHMTERHWADDPNGNLYKGRRPDESPPGGRGAGLVYHGPDPGPYVSYLKQTNASEADWSDVIELTRRLNLSTDANYSAEVGEVVNVEQWMRALAINTLIGNTEFGLLTGDPRGDDYAMYRGIEDTRFQLLVYDWDSLFGGINASIFSANNVPALRRFLAHPDFRPVYYAQLLDVMDNLLLTDTARTTLQQALGGFATPAQIAGIHTYLQARAANVRTQIKSELTAQANLTAVGGVPQTTSGQYALSGSYPQADTRSVRVNGRVATLDNAGNWLFNSGQVSTAPLMNLGSTWRYQDLGQDLGTGWRAPAFDDTQWSSGPGQLGYGDNDEATVVSFGGDPANRHVTTYFRSEFQVNDPRQIGRLVAKLVYDDGVAVFLNGVEVLRANLAADAAYDTLADSSKPGASENAVETFTLPDSALAALVAGRNVLAVEIHQSSRDSSDISFDLALEAQILGTGQDTLRGGMNRLTITTHSDAAGTSEPLATKTLDIWYSKGTDKTITGTLNGVTQWTATGGPYRIQGEVTVPTGATLAIEPGTTVFFEQDARLTIRGQLVALGTEDAPIWFTRRPGTTAWRGIQFVGSTADNRLRHAILEYGISGDGMIGLTNANLTVESSWFDRTDRRRIRSTDSSLIVRDSTFTSIFPPGQQPTTDNQSEHLWGGGIPTGGHFLLEGNFFGHITGHNDSVDFDSVRGKGIYAQILNNVFEGGGDDALDMSGDVYIEGNSFRNFLKDSFNVDPGNSNTISSSNGDFWVVRNVFENVQHTTIVKENAFSHFLYNTVASSQFEPIYFDLPGQTSGPGRGAIVVGSVFNTQATTFGAVLPTTQLTVQNSFMRAADATLYAGNGNQFGAPHVAGHEGDFQLLPGSPAIGAGVGGIDMGASIPAGAVLAGVPAAVTPRRDATIVVSGAGITEYRYQLDQGPLLGPFPASQPIALSNLADGDHRVAVYGRNGIGNWQETPNLSSTWKVASTAAALRINEVLARNEQAYPQGAHRPDFVELFNAGDTPLSLEGFSLGDQPGAPGSFIFPAGATLAAGAYLVLQGGDAAGSAAFDLDFALDGAGDGVYLFNPSGKLVDSVQFGPQLADLSIGRLDQEQTSSTGIATQWALNQPSPGAANRLAAVGDPSSLQINEWYTNGEIRLRDDFLEIYNPAQLPVELGGLSLTDKPFAFPHLATIAPLSFIGAEGYTAFLADGHPEDGPLHLGFKLDTQHEHLALVAADGRRIDEVLYYPQTSEWSEGRLPDGAATTSFRELPTPNVTNGGGASQTVTVMKADWNAEWRYSASGEDLGTAWREPAFNDAAWLAGPGPLGNENEALPVPLKTTFPLKGITYYFRSHVQLEHDPAGVVAQFETQIDDGAIVYVNGTEVRRIGMPSGEITATTLASRSVNEAAIEGPFLIPAAALRQGDNVIAVEVHQSAANSTDMVFGLDVEGNIEVFEPTTGNRQALFEQLRITELMYHPASESAPEYLELQNIGTTPLDLSGVRLGGGIEFEFPRGMQLAGGQYVVVAEDTTRFLQTYGNGVALAGEFSGQLSDGGDTVSLLFPNPLDTAILRFDYSPAWQPSTNGLGAALLVKDPAQDFRLWGSAAGWQATPGAGTPGYNSGTLPATQRLVINEVLSHTDPPLSDSIELFNAGGSAINASGWIISDRQDAAAGFRIPAGTLLAANGYRVLQQADFDKTTYGEAGFGLDGAHGDDLWIWRTDAQGNPQGIVDQVGIGAQANGESWGRVPNGTGIVAPQLSRTLGAANSGVRVGPLVLSEVQYHPTNPSAAALQVDPTLRDEDLEYVEIYNPTAGSVDLSHWRIAGGVDFEFPLGQRINSRQALLVVSFNPANATRTAAFRTHYGLAPTVPLLGGYGGTLNNSGDTVRLLRADEPPTGEPNFYPGLLEDEIRYDDVAPWPTAADGTGASLTRNLPAAWGVLPASWLAADPTPGRVGAKLPGDFNGDNLVNEADIQILCAAQGSVRPDLNLTGDSTIDFSDVTYLVQDILLTNFGDANLDGIFNSSDLVQVFVTGKYEAIGAAQATWSEGDWNCDGRFTTADLVVAFQGGGYSAAAAPASVPADGLDWAAVAAALASDDERWNDQED